MPADALLQTDSTCTPTDAGASAPSACTYGPDQRDASSVTAVLGDSHAIHWRPAVALVADRLRWHVLDFAQPGCPFSEASYVARPDDAAGCRQLNDDDVQYLQAHPEVRTVVVSEDHESYVPHAGSGAATQLRAGFAAAWRRVPATVRHIVVIRDVDYEPPGTADCVTRAARRGQDAGYRCSVSRPYSLAPDYAAEEARRERAADPGSRPVVVDLTRFLCGRRRCFPVVGGVLVHRDPSHMTALFTKTLGPYLLLAISRAVGP